MVAGATVVLDDIARPGERETVAGWEASSDWRFALDRQAGIAIGRRDQDTKTANRNSSWVVRFSTCCAQIRRRRRDRWVSIRPQARPGSGIRDFVG
jgi:hypothetical protein